MKNISAFRNAPVSRTRRPGARAALPALLLLLACLSGGAAAQSPTSTAFPPDERFKTDILLVVAHPDDETAVGPFLAREIYDEGKTVAIVYCNRGTGGGNTRGNEQAASLGAIREIEGRRAAATLGIDRVWFLSGRDTPGQDVLRSLQEWKHGVVLEELIRIVRLTRPEVILTWLPHFVAGENHGDHQASAVIALEAFDMAGDPNVFPAQVTQPRERGDIANATEGLRPWQPKKIYFFSDASHRIEADGPPFSVSAVSPSKKVPYIQLGALVHVPHETQGEGSQSAKKALASGDFTSLAEYHQRFKLIFGKSVVSCSPRGDVFEGLTLLPAPFTPPPGYRPQRAKSPSLTLGGVFAFYRDFWPAHGIERLAGLVQPEIEIAAGSYLFVPLVVSNPTADSLTVSVASALPGGWNDATGPVSCRIGPGESLPLSMFVVCPGNPGGPMEDLRWTASAGGKPIGSVTMRVGLVEWNLPQ